MIRNKLFTGINIIGLSVSLACCLLLFFYAANELSFDKHHGPSVYRLNSTLSQKDGDAIRVASSSIPVAQAIKAEVPEITHAARATSSDLFGGKNVIIHEDNSWHIEKGYIADTSIFSVLKYKIIAGNRYTPISHPDGVVLDRHWAKTIFGDEDPIGQTVKVSSMFGISELEVTAVFDPDSYRTHLNPSFFMSMAHSSWNDFFNKSATNWVGNNIVFTYLKLIPEANTTKVEELVHEIFLRNGAETMKAMGMSKRMNLQAITDVHTDTDFMFNVPGTTNLTFVRVLVSIGVLILLLACVNYINLSTAQAGKRALEVGVRKVMGVTPKGLITQFMGESFLLVLLSLILSVLLAQLALPFFNQLIDNPLSFGSEYYPALGVFVLAFLVITGLLAGFYPAFYLASFKPSSVLKGKNKDKLGASLLRKGLVVVQFVISIGLISAIIVISKQVDYIKDKELGFDPNTKLIVPLTSDESSNQYENLKHKFSTNAQVSRVSGSNAIPGSQNVNDRLVYKDGQTMDDAIHIYNNDVDLEYAQVMGLKLLSGMFFQDYNKDTTRSKILISRTGVDMLGINIDEAPGQLIYFNWENNRFDYEIVGVVEDIHQSSLHQVIDPVMYTIDDGRRYNYITLEANLENFQDLISGLEREWKELVKSEPFEYYALYDHLLLQYESDFNTFDLIKYFALISIVISCLGLYAMSLFTAERRFQEIGIRKAFGAEIKNIVVMVSTDLSKLIIISFALSIPLSIFVMNKWLETFAYKISLGIDIYLLSGIISILIGWLTIGYQSIKAARTNPVDVLREE